MAPTSLLVQVLARDQKSLRLYRFDVETGARRRCSSRRPSDTWVNLHDDLRVVEATGEFLWSSERTGLPAPRAPRPRREADPRPDRGRLARRRRGRARPRNGARSGSRRAGRARSRRISTASRSMAATVERVTTRAGDAPRRSSPATASTSSTSLRAGRGPPVTTLRDRSGRSLATLDDAGDDPRIAELRLDPPALTEFKNRDGVRLFGAYYAPKATAPGVEGPARGDGLRRPARPDGHRVVGADGRPDRAVPRPRAGSRSGSWTTAARPGAATPSRRP